MKRTMCLNPSFNGYSFLTPGTQLCVTSSQSLNPSFNGYSFLTHKQPCDTHVEITS